MVDIIKTVPLTNLEISQNPISKLYYVECTEPRFLFCHEDLRQVLKSAAGAIEFYEENKDQWNGR